MQKLFNTMPIQRNFKVLLSAIDKLLLLFSLSSFGVIIFEMGFEHSSFETKFIQIFYILCLSFYLITSVSRSYFSGLNLLEKTVSNGLRYCWYASLIIAIIAWFCILMNGANQFSFLNIYTYSAITIIYFVELSRLGLDVHRLNISPNLFFVFTFVVLILFGASLLMLPNASTHVNGSQITLVDAIFTSTSAVCVTGLSVQDTQFFFTKQGQAIIMFLIQLGGLGVMTFTSFFGFFFPGSSSFKNQLFIKDMVNAEQLGQVFRTVLKVLFVTFLIETIGGIILFNTISNTMQLPFGERLWFSVFHTVSAFCNAGFSTISANLYDANLRFNYGVQLTIAFLIILGGIGFPIVFNLTTYIKKKLKYQILPLIKGEEVQPIVYHRTISLSTKIVLYTTLILLAMGTLCFSLLEWNNSTMQEHTTYWGKLVTGFFLSVTGRTAGFNTVNMEALTVPSIMLMLFFMWVGASPASTGGGIKTTTFAIGTLNILNTIRNKERLEIFKREIEDSTIKRAFAIISLSLIVLGISTFLIYTFEYKWGGLRQSTLDPNINLVTIAFEAFSAFGTVGLSINLTPKLTDASKIVLIITMLLGRVSTLTLLIGLFRQIGKQRYRYPTEDVPM